jgi:hypothetical protein
MALLLPSPAVASALPNPSRRTVHSQYCARQHRSSVVCSFSLPGGFAPLPQLFGPRQQTRQQHVQEHTPQPLHSLDDYCEQSDAYSSLLHQAEEVTFSMSPATLSMLEEAERMVEVCIQVRVSCACRHDRLRLCSCAFRISQGVVAHVFCCTPLDLVILLLGLHTQPLLVSPGCTSHVLGQLYQVHTAVHSCLN